MAFAVAISVVRGFVREQFVSKGQLVDFARGLVQWFVRAFVRREFARARTNSVALESATVRFAPCRT